MRQLIARWRDDPGAAYRSWFLWEERLENLRSIRRGIEEVVAEITAGTFGNVYRGSTLETVVRSVAEQRQLFRGADHAFLCVKADHARGQTSCSDVAGAL